MGKKKKKKSSTPRAKSMNRESRLQSAAASWLNTYDGNRHIRGYRKHFGVDAGTAIAELRMLGVSLTDEAVRNAKKGAQAAVKAKQARKEKRLQLQKERQSGAVPRSDETYAYIAGYTGWGFPYGITWEEMERYADKESLDDTVPPRSWGRQTTVDEAGRPFIDERDAEEAPFDLEEFMRCHAECEVS